ncbi:MAG TPA: YafY family protein [Caproicibacter sp.]|nr:YafY family protein [Caproicibacter sp.]
MKADRLLGIINALTLKPKIKAKELAERYEVSLRTIYRDIDTISRAGIPIVTYPGGDGGIGIAEGFKLDKSALSREELQSIILGLKSLGSVMSSSSVESLLNKLSPDSNSFFAVKDKIVINLASHYKNSLAPKINLLQKAIESKRTVRFEYFSKNGKTVRMLEPYFIAFQWSAWYVFGYCRLRHDFRLFKLNRINLLELTGESFVFRNVTKEQLNLEAFYSDPATKNYAVLLLDKNLEYIMVDEYGPDSYEFADEDHILAKWDYVNEYEMVKTILGLGAGAKVLAPESLVQAVRKETEKILNQYL